MSDLIRPGDAEFGIGHPERTPTATPAVRGEVLDGEVVTLSIRPAPGHRADGLWECFDTKTGRPVGWASRGIRCISGRRDEVEMATRALCAHEAFRYQAPDGYLPR